MSDVEIAILLLGILGFAVGVFGLAVAVRERRQGSRWWAWVLPGTFGVWLVVMGLLRVIGAVT